MERLQIPLQIQPRALNTHKGTYGRVLAVAGSRWFPGAAILVARAALRTGSGLVAVATPTCVSTALAAVCPEAIQAPADNAAEVDPRSPFQAAAIGPGLGTDDRAHALVTAFLGFCDRPLVVDADALNVISSTPTLRADPRATRVWTPHPGEFKRLLGEHPISDAERMEAAVRFEARYGGVLVLKGHRTVVVDRSRFYVNNTGNPGMATAGSGDVLSGVILSLLGQGFAPFDAAALSVYLHGLAGDLARDSRGEASLIASDIIDHLPEAIRKHTRNS